MSTGTLDGDNATPRLLADVGGTNARFALQQRGGPPTRIEVLSTADFAGFEAAAKSYLRRAGNPAVRHAVIGVATAVTGDAIEMTNNPWRFSIEATRHALGLDTLFAINDFTALAWSLPGLPAHELAQVGGGAPLPDAPRALIGPGTGLGVSALVPDTQGGFSALAGEGGHVAFAPTDEIEMELWHAGRAAFGRVSVERLVSGPGLVFIHQTLCRRAGETPQDLNPADISRIALANDGAAATRCRAALDVFLAILGQTAGDLALTLGARGGVYIGGGIVPRLGDYLQRSPFRARFDAKGRFEDYNAAIPVFVIHSEHPALTGAAGYLEARLGSDR